MNEKHNNLNMKPKMFLSGRKNFRLPYQVNPILNPRYNFLSNNLGLSLQE